VNMPPSDNPTGQTIVSNQFLNDVSAHCDMLKAENARMELEIAQLRAGLRAIAEMAEGRSRVNMLSGISLAAFSRCCLLADGKETP